MAIHKYKKGDVVDVYQKPITKEIFEGKAKIIKLNRTDNYYNVQFVKNIESEDKHNRYSNLIYSRFVY